MTSLGGLEAPASIDHHKPPLCLHRAQHGIDANAVDDAALTVVQGLQDAGFDAFLVGGCVRDLLLGLSPKDFDVATNATPEDVKRVFRRARLIGRRFRIAHVRVGREVIEVSTFRQRAVAEDVTHARSRRDLKDLVTARSAEGLILRDNAYGTIDEDAFRRDFSVNALYYDPVTETVLDYVGGLDDLRQRRLRLIGDAATRLREDPVRILRAVRFAAKLDFDIDPETRDAIPHVASSIDSVAPARLFDELCKLFLLGHAAAAWELLQELGLVSTLFPDLRRSQQLDRLIATAMRGTDDRVKEDKPVTPGFLFAVLLWDSYQEKVAQYAEDRTLADPREAASSATLQDRGSKIVLPKRHAQFVREVWSLQPRLEAPKPRTVERLVAHPRFRAAYDFLLLRAESGEIDRTMADWWTSYQAEDTKTRAALRSELVPDKARRRRRRSRRPPAS